MKSKEIINLPLPKVLSLFPQIKQEKFNKIKFLIEMFQEYKIIQNMIELCENEESKNFMKEIEKAMNEDGLTNFVL